MVKNDGKKIIKKLLENGIPIGQIAEETGLTKEEIEKIINKNTIIK